MLKLDNGEKAWPHVFRLLKVFLCLGQPMYEGALILQLCLLCYYRSTNHPIWQMMKHNLSMFNEEAGELCFSVLARCTVKDTMKYSFSHLSDKFALIRPMSDMHVEFGLESSATVKGGQHVNINHASVEVSRLADMFLNMVGEIKAGTYKPYRRLQAENAKYQSKEQEMGQLVFEDDVKRIFLEDCIPLLKLRVDKMKANFFCS